MKCPECGGTMKEFKRGVAIVRTYGTCQECRYTCSEDFVSGYWYGYRKGKETSLDD